MCKILQHGSRLVCRPAIDILKCVIISYNIPYLFMHRHNYVQERITLKKMNKKVGMQLQKVQIQEE